jgi:hypothetical protein
MAQVSPATAPNPGFRPEGAALDRYRDEGYITGKEAATTEEKPAMDSLPFAMNTSLRRMDLEAHSALPDAPVVLDREPAHPVRHSRSIAAAALRRLADRMAPDQPALGPSTLGC